MKTICNFNIRQGSKLFLILLVSVFFFWVVSGFVSGDSYFGHSAEDVMITIKGTSVSLQEAYDQGFLGTDIDFDSSSSGLKNLKITDVAVSQGYYHDFMCVLLDTDEVKCTGSNNYGQLGLGDYWQRNKFELVVDLNNVEKLVNLGRINTCGILKDTGKVKCWGYNAYGQLGIGSTASQNIPAYVLNGFDDSHLEDVEKIVGKEMHNAYQSVCALTSESEGNLYCWGYNGYGQLGVGDTSSRSKATNVPGFGLLSVKDVFVGGHSSGGFSCAIVGDSREVYCWGYNGYGQLGVGDKVKKTVPQKVAGLSDVNSLELSHSDYGTSCAIVGDSREVYCWGYNGYGQLGVGDKVAKTVPQKIEGINNVLKLNSIGSGTTTSYCALKTDGSLYCWGYNGYGRLGVGDNLYKTIPTAVADLNNVKDIDGYGYGTYGHYCAIVGDSREVYCWGYNGYGQLGQGSSGNSYYNSPQKVLGLDGKIVENISCGGYHAGNICSAILSDKTMRVWGYNGYGNLGTGDTLNKYTATAPE